MIRDITIGQYYPADSIVHKLDPRVKLFTTLIYIIALFSFKGILSFAIIGVFLFAAVKLSKVPFKFIVKGLKAIVMILLITAVFNLFLTPGDVILWQFKSLKITDVGLTNAVVMMSRLILLIIGTSLMTLTTTPNQLTDGLETALKPLNIPKPKPPIGTFLVLKLLYFSYSSLVSLSNDVISHLLSINLKLIVYIL